MSESLSASFFRPRTSIPQPASSLSLCLHTPPLESSHGRPPLQNTFPATERLSIFRPAWAWSSLCSRSPRARSDVGDWRYLAIPPHEPFVIHHPRFLTMQALRLWHNARRSYRHESWRNNKNYPCTTRAGVKPELDGCPGVLHVCVHSVQLGE